jgi:hypothetical protein
MPPEFVDDMESIDASTVLVSVLLAEALAVAGLNLSYVSAVEPGYKNLTLMTLIALSTALGCP